jgi:hypothetical protein
MGVEKMSVSFELELGEAIRASATAAGQTVSAWLAEAARGRLHLEALEEAVAAWEQEHGRLTEPEVAQAEQALERAATGRRSGAA